MFYKQANRNILQRIIVGTTISNIEVNFFIILDYYLYICMSTTLTALTIPVDHSIEDHILNIVKKEIDTFEQCKKELASLFGQPGSKNYDGVMFRERKGLTNTVQCWHNETYWPVVAKLYSVKCFAIEKIIVDRMKLDYIYHFGTTYYEEYMKLEQSKKLLNDEISNIKQKQSKIQSKALKNNKYIMI